MNRPPSPKAQLKRVKTTKCVHSKLSSILADTIQNITAEIKNTDVVFARLSAEIYRTIE